MKYGFIGAGAIASAMVKGICEGNAGAPEIILSPRNQNIASDLADRYENVHIAKSNKDVIDKAAVTIICLRPAVGRSELKSLKFREDALVVSAMAGVSVDEIRSLVHPAKTVVRIIPLPRIAVRGSITPIYPPNEITRELFDPLGGSVEMSDESLFDAFSAVTATIAAHFAYVSMIARWLGSRGVPAADAVKYVTSIFAGLGEALKAGENLDELVKEHATPGGTNELFLSAMIDGDIGDKIERGLDRVFNRLTNTVNEQ